MALPSEKLYCENCMRLIAEPVCPRCRNRKLREPEAGDFCMVADIPYLQAEMLKEVYRDNDVPYVDRSVLGAGLTAELGRNVDRVRLYVPYDRLPLAQELFDAFFNSQPIFETVDDPE